MIQRKSINLERTGFNLRQLRISNINLRRYVCGELSPRNNRCDAKNCVNCPTYEMDHIISQAELAEVFWTTDNVVQNLESSRTLPPIEDLILYAEICKIDFFDLLVFNS